VDEVTRIGFDPVTDGSAGSRYDRRGEEAGNTGAGRT